MDKKAFQKMSYGLYIISSSNDGVDSGCIVNTFNQVTSSPAQVSVTLNKENLTTQLIENSCVFHCSVLLDEVSMDVIRNFGFQSGRDADKFANYDFKRDVNHIKYVDDGVSAHFACRVVKMMDVGTHIIFVAEVEDAKVMSDNAVLTYENYHKTKKGETPKNAPTYQETDKSGWRCSICGFVLEEEELPVDYVCPVCKQPASVFEKIEKA